MAVYINGMGVISPQNSFECIQSNDRVFPDATHRFTCIEPDYSAFIDVKAIRRMSRIIKMAVACSLNSLKESNLEKPDAIIVGTALGCLEDTISFLNKLVVNKEELLNPTAFIHSTHNTIASQIALNVKCMGYNSTYVHRNISFETALLDAGLLLEENIASNVLVGGIDELTEVSLDILQRLSYYSNDTGKSLNAVADGSEAGEGSSFFTLSKEKNNNTYAEFKEVKTVSFTSCGEVQELIKRILSDSNIDKLDLILSGLSGQKENSIDYNFLYNDFVSADKIIQFKEFCGEYPTSSAYAMSFAAKVLRDQQLPAFIGNSMAPGGRIENILIHNNYKDVHHSLILLSAC